MTRQAALLILPLSIALWIIFGCAVEAATIGAEYPKETRGSNDVTSIAIVHDAQRTQIDVVPVEATESILPDGKSATNVNYDLSASRDRDGTVSLRLGIPRDNCDIWTANFCADININADLEYLSWGIANIRDYEPSGSGLFRLSKNNSPNPSYGKARSMSGVEFLTGDLNRFIGDEPECSSEDSDCYTGKGRNKPIVFISKDQRFEDNGRYDVVTGTIIWGAIFALSAYFGYWYAAYRYRRNIRSDYYRNKTNSDAVTM